MAKKIEIPDDFECKGCEGCGLDDLEEMLSGGYKDIECVSIGKALKGKTITISDKDEKLYTEDEVNKKQKALAHAFMECLSENTQHPRGHESFIGMEVYDDIKNIFSLKGGKNG